MKVEERLRQWADARERRNGVDGFGKTGTSLLREAADNLEAAEEREKRLSDHGYEWEQRARTAERERDAAREFAAEKQTSLVSQWRRQAEAAERERNALQDKWYAENVRAAILERSLATAREALERIEALQSRGGTYAVEWTDGGWQPAFKVIARSVLRSLEEEA